MCGIVGYIGPKGAVPILLEGLKKLEYRGYDSAGIAVIEDKKLELRKAEGKLRVLEDKLSLEKFKGNVGLGHTRWATHGRPSDENAHPHQDCGGKLALVHNGIIENFQEIKRTLEKEGHTFSSETDTEVVVHLVEKFFAGNLSEAVQKATAQLEGSYAIAVINQENPDQIVAYRQDSPLILGIGEGEYYLASDIPALLPYTRRIIILEDGEMAELNRENYRVIGSGGELLNKEIEEIDWDLEMAEKKGFAHYMLKEIHEQPDVMRQLLEKPLGGSGIELPEIDAILKSQEKIDKIFIVACGTAYHSGLIGKALLEKATGIPVEVDMASEFRYRSPLIGENSLVIVVSQSGETADTLAALRHAREKRAKTLGIVNVQGSTIAREADQLFLIEAGPEIAVASTKAYLNMLAAFNLLALKMSDGDIPGNEIGELLHLLREIPAQVEKTLFRMEKPVRKAAKYIKNWDNAFFVGRGLDFSLALEGALKLKEISYIHAEAYAAGELKHGTLALIEEGIPVVALLTQESLLEKMISNIQEIRARGGYVFGITQDRFASRVAEEVDFLFRIPNTADIFAPLLGTVPLQLLSYFTADFRDCPIDQPRNLAKSVTVE